MRSIETNEEYQSRFKQMCELLAIAFNRGGAASNELSELIDVVVDYEQAHPDERVHR